MARPTPLTASSQAIGERCSQGQEVRDYFDIGVITYTTTGFLGSLDLGSVLPRTSPEQPFLKVSQVVDAATVEDRQVKESDGAGGLVATTKRFPVWLRPQAKNGTPMCGALSAASGAIQDWTSQHPDSYPPMVINISDGEATDGNPESVAQEIMALGTNDGNVLLYNIHLSEEDVQPVQYPSDESSLPPDEYAAQMFRMSSEFPEQVVDMAPGLGLPVTRGLARIRLQRRHGGPGAVPGHRHPRRLRPALTRVRHPSIRVPPHVQRRPLCCVFVPGAIQWRRPNH